MRPELLRDFLAQYTHRANGHAITFAEFRQRFHAWLPRGERYQWSNYHISRKLRANGVIIGTRTANKSFLGNLSWERVPPAGEFIQVKRRLVLV